MSACDPKRTLCGFHLSRDKPTVAKETIEKCTVRCDRSVTDLGGTPPPAQFQSRPLLHTAAAQGEVMHPPFMQGDLKYYRSSPAGDVLMFTAIDACVAEGDGTLVVDHAAGETGQDWSQGRSSWPVRHVPTGRGGGDEGAVPENPEPD